MVGPSFAGSSFSALPLGLNLHASQVIPTVDSLLLSRLSPRITSSVIMTVEEHRLSLVESGQTN